MNFNWKTSWGFHRHKKFLLYNCIAGVLFNIGAFTLTIIELNIGIFFVNKLPNYFYESNPMTSLFIQLIGNWTILITIATVIVSYISFLFFFKIQDKFIKNKDSLIYGCVNVIINIQIITITLGLLKDMTGDLFNYIIYLKEIGVI